jgi:S-adenosylmethionine/arginine decarboxylase-like enzyme
MTTDIGQEYTVIGWCKNRDLLNDERLLKGLLTDVCKEINMRPLRAIGVDVPIALEKMKAEQFEDEGGSSAVLILSTSHASIHGWPERDQTREDGAFFWLSVGSCRGFDSRKVDAVINPMLHVTEADRFGRYISIMDGKFSSMEEARR